MIRLPDNSDVAHIVRRYGEAKGAAPHWITWGLNAAGIALRNGAPATGAALHGIDEIDAAEALMRETSNG